MRVFNFDLIEGWTTSGEPDRLWGISFSNGDAIRFRTLGLTFGYSVTIDGAPYESSVFPGENTIWHETSRDNVFPFGIDCPTGAQIEIAVHATWNGETYEVVESYECPPPPAPYPSWSWDGEQWQPPFPCPVIGAIYAWSEQRQEWVGYPDDSSNDYSWDPETEVWVHN